VIPAARGSTGCTTEEVLARLDRSIADFGANVRAKFQREGEW